MLSILGLRPAPVQARLVRRLYGHRFFHLLATVMPGTRRPRHCRGCRIREVYPVLPLADRVGLAVGALHWGSTTGVGITADPGLLPEFGQLGQLVREALTRMSSERSIRP